MKKIRYFLLSICSILLFGKAFIAYAITPPPLYEGQIEVADYSTPEREQAFPKILEGVLIKITGNPDISTLSKIKSNLNKAGTIIESYSYNGTEINGKKVLILTVKFNPQSVNQLVQSVGQITWINQRPILLVWLATENKFGNPILINRADQDIRPELEQIASNLGLQFVLPNIDLKDIEKIQANAIANMDLAAIEDASKKYNLDTILVGHIWQNTINSWRSRWTLLDKNKPIAKWDIENETTTNLLNIAMDNSVKELAKQAKTSSSTNKNITAITLRIEGINNMQDYSDINQYLQNLNSVSKLSTISLGTNYVKFSLNINIDMEQFVTLLNNEGDILVDDSVSQQNSSSNIVAHLL